MKVYIKIIKRINPTISRCIFLIEKIHLPVKLNIKRFSSSNNSINYCVLLISLKNINQSFTQPEGANYMYICTILRRALLSLPEL